MRAVACHGFLKKLLSKKQKKRIEVAQAQEWDDDHEQSVLLVYAICLVDNSANAMNKLWVQDKSRSGAATFLSSW